MKLLVPTLITTLLDAITTESAGVIHALPARPVLLTWQTSFDMAPMSADIDLEVSLDGMTWFVIDTSTNVDGEVRQITTPTNAKFIRVNVIDNAGAAELTVTVLPNVALVAQAPNSLTSDLEVIDGSGAGLVFTFAIQAMFTVFGPLIHIFLDVTYPTTADTDPAILSLPQLAGLVQNGSGSLAITFNDSTINITAYPDGADIILYDVSGNQITNDQLSEKTLTIAGVYQHA